MMRALSLLLLVGCQSAVSTNATSEGTHGVSGTFVDTTAPELGFEPTAHAAWVQAGAFTFVGTATDARSGVDVFFEGQPVELSEAGVFTIEQVLEPGAHTFTVTAEDGVGNATSRSLTVFAGDAIPLRRQLRDAAQVEVGPALLAAAAETLAADFAAADILSDGDAFRPFGGCVAVDAVIDSASAGDVWADIEVDAIERVLYLDVSFEHLSLDISGVADVCGMPETFSSGYVSADGAVARLTLAPDVQGGQLVTTVEGVEVDFTAVQVGLPELSDALAEEGVTADEIGVDAAFSRAFEAPFADREALGERIGEVLFGVMPSVYQEGQRFIEGGLTLSEIRLNGQGLSGRYIAHHVTRGFGPVSGDPAAWLPIAGDAPLPGFTDASASVSVDAINHALATAWWGGAFTQEFSVEEGVSVTTARLRPALPPFVQPAARGLAVNFGEIYVELSEADSLERSTVRLFAEMRTTTTLDRGRFIFSIDPISGEEPEPAVQELLRDAVYRALDDALPSPQEPGWLNGGDQLEAHNPVLAGPQQGWLHSELSVIP